MEWLISRDKASLDILRLRDESLEKSDNLPDPDILAQEIVEDLEAALERFREIANASGAERPVRMNTRAQNEKKFGHWDESCPVADGAIGWMCQAGWAGGRVTSRSWTRRNRPGAFGRRSTTTRGS